VPPAVVYEPAASLRSPAVFVVGDMDAIAPRAADEGHSRAVTAVADVLFPEGTIFVGQDLYCLRA
jgi:hypothetical protein